VGTQMISKGLDFEKVNLVGVLDIDRVVNFPDFRSQEKAYSLLLQVSGRSGRKQKQGKVIVQTYNPEHQIFKAIQNPDFERFFSKEMLEREEFNYPPYYRLIKIVFKDSNKEKVEKCAQNVSSVLKSYIGEKRATRAHEPIISKIRNQYILEVLVRIEKNVNLKTVKSLIWQKVLEINTNKEFRSVKSYFDVDPY